MALAIDSDQISLPFKRVRAGFAALMQWLSAGTSAKLLQTLSSQGCAMLSQHRMLQ